jgi:hypothetical protein
MALLVVKRCPHCGNKYEQGPDSRGIGSPLIRCPSCSRFIIDQDDTEWELMGLWKKAGYVLICIYTAFLFGAVFPILLYFINEDTADSNFALSYLLGVAFIAIWIWKRNSNDMSESKKRMRDPDYRKVLIKCGLLKDKYTFVAEEIPRLNGEGNIITRTAAQTAKYYLELKRNFGSSFPDETSLLAMSGMIHSRAFLFEIQQITLDKILRLAESTAGKKSHHLDFFIKLEALLFYLETSDSDFKGIENVCEKNRESIRKSVLQTLDSYDEDATIANNVRAAMFSKEFAELRQTSGVKT